MSTRSSAKNLFPPLDNPELTIRRRSRTDPTLLNNSEMAAEGNGDLPVLNLWTIEELCQPSLNGRGGPIALIAIQATNFGLKNDMIQQSIKVNGVTDDALRLYLFPHSLTRHATAWFDRLPRNSINTFKQMAKMFLGKYFPPSMVTKLRNEITNFHQHNYLGPPGFNQYQNHNNQNHNFQNQNRNQGNHNPQGNNQGRNQFFQGANQGQNQPPAYQAPAYQALVYQAPVYQPQIPQLQVVTTNEFTNFVKANYAILKNMKTNMTSLTNSNLKLKNMFGRFMKMNTALSLGLGTLLGNTITNPKEDLKGITTRIGTAYPGPKIATTFSLPSVVEHETKATKDTVHPTNNGSIEDVQPSVVPTESLILKSEPDISQIIEPVASLFGPSIKSLLTNKDKLCELARTPLNEHCSVVLLKKFPEKLRDPGKFLIPCDFPGMPECLALANLGASINLMPLSVWNKLSLPDLSPTCMTLELADLLISRSVGVAEDVFVKVGTFHFPTDFIVVDFDADPRVPLILMRSFLKTGRALIDVFKGELTLRVGKEAITFNLDQTSRYSANYNDMTVNRIDIIDMACEEYSQEVFSFFDVIASGNPTPYYDPIVSTTSQTLTSFGESDFLFEEVDTFVALEDDLTSPKVDQSYVDTKGDIILLEAFLNDDPSLLPPNQGNYLPEVRKELKICEAKSDKSSIDEPPDVKLKDLPPHLEYVFLEGDDKLPVIIVKYLSVEEKTALITVLKSHKRAIVWKLSDIKDQEKTTFIFPYRTFAYRRMPFGLCNAPGTFQRCMMAIFHDMIEKTIEVFMDDFSVFRNSFQTCHSHLEKMLKRCEDTNLSLNWEKSHFMVKEGIVLGHKISKEKIEVDKAKVDVITKLIHPTTVKGIRTFLGHVGFYRRFIKDFSKIARPMTRLLEKDTSYLFSKECVEAFQTLKRKLTEAPILIAPDWDMPFELMCDASDFAIGAVLGQR
nr:reverse transcriptase domain-containing protein [Tanacetum cinerariifolium]